MMLSCTAGLRLCRICKHICSEPRITNFDTHVETGYVQCRYQGINITRCNGANMYSARGAWGAAAATGPRVGDREE